jgi:hypothetical protein
VHAVARQLRRALNRARRANLKMTSGLMPVTAGCRLARRLDARFGPDRFPARIRAPEPALAHSSGAAE